MVNSQKYYGGASYGKTFSIKAFDYCQALKTILKSQGVQIFEESPAQEILATGVKTQHGTIEAQKIIVATDRFLPELAPFAYDMYHVQTFLMASAPLPQEQADALFPTRRMMAWDTDLIYHYFRLTPDNRLLLGGADLFSTYSANANYHNARVFKNLTRYAKDYFPHLSLEWEYMWPGLIGITKDIFPLAGKDKYTKNIYYIGGAAGLPWAAALGNYAIDSLYDNRAELDKFFNPYRRYLIPHAVQAIIGTKLSFALSNFQKVGSL
jgi:gamma-glutamylputrescine oxidase